MDALKPSGSDPEIYILVTLWILRLWVTWLYSRNKWKHGQIARWMIYAAMIATVVVWGIRKQKQMGIDVFTF
jgi:hypothetical protein